MQFTTSTTINLPRQEVVNLWQNQDYLAKWQDGFVKIEQLSGIPGKEGSTSNLFYKNGKREMVLKETIIENKLPKRFRGLYEHKHMINIMTVVFEIIDDQVTSYESSIEYTKFNGLIPKMMALLFPGMFKKQVQKWQNQFKDFAESYNN